MTMLTKNPRRTEDWWSLLERLRAKGWTQSQIAAAVGSTQSTISDLARLDRGDPVYFVGAALVRMDKSKRRRGA